MQNLRSKVHLKNGVSTELMRLGSFAEMQLTSALKQIEMRVP